MRIRIHHLLCGFFWICAGLAHGQRVDRIGQFRYEPQRLEEIKNMFAHIPSLIMTAHRNCAMYWVRPEPMSCTLSSYYEVLYTFLASQRKHMDMMIAFTHGIRIPLTPADLQLADAFEYYFNVAQIVDQARWQYGLPSQPPTTRTIELELLEMYQIYEVAMDDPALTQQESKIAQSLLDLDRNDRR